VKLPYLVFGCRACYVKRNPSLLFNTKDQFSFPSRYPVQLIGLKH